MFTSYWQSTTVTISRSLCLTIQTGYRPRLWFFTVDSPQSRMFTILYSSKESHSPYCINIRLHIKSVLENTHQYSKLCFWIFSVISHFSKNITQKRDSCVFINLFVRTFYKWLKIKLKMMQMFYNRRIIKWI